MITTLRYLVITVLAMSYADLSCLAESDSTVQSSFAGTAPVASQSYPDVEEVKEAMLAEQTASIQHYEQMIDQLESSGGVYQVQLSEVLLGLGTGYQALNRHADAVAVFERSLHINRVNNGLYSLNQVAILEKLIESNSKLKNWDGLNKNYHNLYWISKRHYGANNPELLDIIDRIGRWHLKAYELQPEAESFSHLVDAEQLYNKAVDIIEAHNGKRDIRLINALYGIALTNHQIASEVSNTDNFDDIRSGFRNSYQTRRMLQENRAREDLIMRSYKKGKDAMLQIVDIYASNPVLPVEIHALALTHLGDWYLLFNKKNSAATTYDQAYQLLHQEGIAQEKIDALFGQPRSLPAIHLPVQYEDDITPENPPYVVASFDVSASGKARNIEIIESRPIDSVSHQRRARKSIASTRFRPRYENGKPVITTGVSLRYVFTD